MPHSAASSASESASDAVSSSTAASSAHPSNTNTTDRNIFTLTLANNHTFQPPATLSPAFGGFNFAALHHDVDDSEPESPILPRRIMDRDYLIDRPSPPERDAQQDREDNNRKRSRWYEDQFAVRPVDSVADKVGREAPVIVELRTNVIVSRPNSYLLLPLTDSFPPGQRRVHSGDRPLVAGVGALQPARVVHHGDRRALGLHDVRRHLRAGLPAHHHDAAPVRPAGDQQAQRRPDPAVMTEILGVSPERGIVAFKALAEENMAMGGKTVMGQIEHEEDPIGLKRRLTAKTNRRSLMSRGGEDDSGFGAAAQVVHAIQQRQRSISASRARCRRRCPVPSRFRSHAARRRRRGTRSDSKGSPNQVRPSSSRRMMMKMTGQEPMSSVISLSPPPIPEDPPMPKVSKRKSLIAMFKR